MGKNTKKKGFEKINEGDDIDNEMSPLEDKDISLQKFEDSEFTDKDLIQRNFGNYCVFRFDQNGEPKYAIGPQWPLFIFCWGSTFVFCYVIYSVHKIYINEVLTHVINLFMFLTLYFYFMTAIKNPGIISTTDPMATDSSTHCIACRVKRDPKIMHCFDCDVCIEELDHHCIWTGKCIGKGNLNTFRAFIFFTFSSLILLLIASFYNIK